MPAAYPTGADLLAYITSLGVLNSGQLTAITAGLTARAAAAAARWEREVGWLPFLATGSASTRRFDPPGPNDRGLTRGGDKRLYLSGALVTSTAPVVRSGVTTASAGDLLTIEDDYFLGPENADQTGMPWRWVEFGWNRWGPPRSISVTGLWGWSATVPDDVWQAVLGLGARTALETTTRISGGRSSWKEADSGENFGATPLQFHLEEWGRVYAETLSNYRRIEA